MYGGRSRLGSGASEAAGRVAGAWRMVPGGPARLETVDSGFYLVKSHTDTVLSRPSARAAGTIETSLISQSGISFRT